MKLLKKKNADGPGGGKAAKKTDKKPKRKTKGAGGGLASAKAFCAHHIEKVLLAAIAIASLLIVFSGFRKDRIQTSPEAVRSAINSAKSQISKQTWAEVVQDRRPAPDTFQDRANLDSVPISLAAYAMNRPFFPRLQEQSKKRSDPTLLAPIQIEAKANYGGLAIKDDGDGGLSGMIRAEGRPVDGDSQIGEVPLGGTYVSRYFVSVTGLVPYKKQFDLYLEAFRGAQDYDTDRDIPHYIDIQVQRADVNADGSLGEWVTLDTVQARDDAAMNWDGRTDDIGDPEYIIKELTMPLPPIVRRDIAKWGLHSTVPVVERDGGLGRRERERANEERRGDRDELARLRRGNFDRPESERGEEEMVDYDDIAKPELSVENGMFRYIDMTVEPGKAYQYRVQLVLDDPNNPVTEGRRRPISQACETAVLVRLKSSQEPLIRSPWSESSPTARVPQGSRVFASAAEQPSTQSFGQRNVVLPRRPGDEPSIKLLTLTWDAAETRDVPVEIEVQRGAILNGRVAEVEAIDPAKNKIITLNNYSYSTGAMVLDIMGGTKMVEGLHSPASVLLLKDGKLEFHNEFGDQEAFERNEIPEDKDADIIAEQRAREVDEDRGREGRGREGGRRTRGSR